VKPAAVLVAALKHGALLLVLGILAAQDTTLGATWGQRVDKMRGCNSWVSAKSLLTSFTSNTSNKRIFFLLSALSKSPGSVCTSPTFKLSISPGSNPPVWLARLAGRRPLSRTLWTRAAVSSSSMSICRGGCGVSVERSHINILGCGVNC
jgi:hypothetical protein